MIFLFIFVLNNDNWYTSSYLWYIFFFFYLFLFIRLQGDNFYVDGVKNATDPLWNTAFHNVYTAPSLQIPWYPIVGNHDYHQSIQGQIDRTYLEGETMWTFPSNYYVKSYTLNDGGKMTIVYIDTAVIEPFHDDTSSVYLDPNMEQKLRTHLQWIDDTLAVEKETATWLIVMGHYPIYSVGANCDNVYLLNDLLPLLQKHRVHMYVAGHDHNHQWIEKDGITYVVSGQSGGRGPFGISVIIIELCADLIFVLFFSFPFFIVESLVS